VKEKVFRFSTQIISLIFHLGSWVIVLYFVWPILVLYWNSKPAVGIDLFLSVDFVTYIRDHLNWPWASWKYIWYGGTPLLQTYPLLHFYLMQPFLNWFSAVQAVQIYVLSSICLFFIFSYLLFYTISKSRALAVVLSIATAYSYNLWSSLFWSGSIPYFATLFLLPLSLYLIFLGFDKGNKKYIYLAGFLSGLFLLAHPQSFLAFIVPFSAILIAFFWSGKTKLITGGKIALIFFYGLIILLVGFPQAGDVTEVLGFFLKTFSSIFKTGSVGLVGYVGPEGSSQAPSEFHRIFDLYRRSNPLFFYALAAGLVSSVFTTVLAFVIRKRVSHYLKLLIPIGAMVLYLAIFIYGFVLGLNPIAGGWFRAFWSSMTIFGVLVSVFWRISINNLELVIGGWENKPRSLKWFGFLAGTVLGGLVLIEGTSFLQISYADFRKEALNYSEISSAMPSTLSKDIKRGDWPEKLPKLTPDWLNPNDLSYRLYDMDATVNIWWSSIFKMPLARGYLDASPKGSGAENYAGWQYWQNVTLNKDEIVKFWDVPEVLAREQAKFLIDWHGIKFLEGTQTSSRIYGSNISSYISGDSTIVKRNETITVLGPLASPGSDGRTISDRIQELNYYEVDNQATSPIYSATNAPTILLIGSTIGQDTMMRNLAFLNLNSKRAIIVQWNRPIDDLSESEMKKFDLIILYWYKYNSQGKAFKKLDTYVKNGGNLFIDTGTEQKESNSQNLPQLFAFSQSERKPFGYDWDLETKDDDITRGVDLGKFSEPVFDGQPWNFAYPVSSFRYQTKVLLTNHQKPVLVSYGLGKGKVVWSGMNFAGHVQRFKNDEEVKLFRNILFYFVDFSRDQNLETSFERPSSEEVIIRGAKAKGILFKEAAYSGWEVRVKADGLNKKLPIYQAGPMVPGYMYVFLPDQTQKGSFEAVFQYKGELTYKLAYFVSFLSIFLLLDLIFFRAIISRILGKIFGRIQRRVGKWWEKEEEE